MISTLLLAALAAAAAVPDRERELPVIPAVSGEVFTRGGRLELSPLATLSVNDAFYRKSVFGLGAAYHLGETVAVAGYAGYALSTPARSMQLCGTAQAPDGCAFPSEETLRGWAPGRLLGVAGLELQLAPLYGKLSLFAESFVSFDVYLVAGGAAVLYEGPGDAPDTTALRPGVGGKLGLGAHVFLTRWLALRACAQELVYLEVLRRNDALQSAVRPQLMVELGLSFFLPSFSEQGS